MNQTIKKATVHRYHYNSHDQLRQYLQSFIDAYNFAKKLKSLKGLTPFDFILSQWNINPDLFKLNSDLHTLEPDSEVFLLNTSSYTSKNQWRFNNRHNNIYKILLSNLRKTPFNLVLNQVFYCATV